MYTWRFVQVKNCFIRPRVQLQASSSNCHEMWSPSTSMHRQPLHIGRVTWTIWAKYWTTMSFLATRAAKSKETQIVEMYSAIRIYSPSAQMRFVSEAALISQSSDDLQGGLDFAAGSSMVSLGRARRTAGWETMLFLYINFSHPLRDPVLKTDFSTHVVFLYMCFSLPFVLPSTVGLLLVETVSASLLSLLWCLFLP